jgi:ATP-dependent Lon protease
MKTKKINAFLPTLILKNTILMPSISIPVMITKNIAKNAINRSLETDKLLFVTTLKDGNEIEKAHPSDFYSIGTLATIEKTTKNENGELIVFIKSIDRYRLVTIEFQEAFASWFASGEAMPDLYDLESGSEQSILKNLKDISFEILNYFNANKEFKENINRYSTVADFSNIICQNLPILISKKQEILEIQSIKDRSLKVLELLVEQREMLKINTEMGLVISEKTSKAYRESILREQLIAIKRELGDDQDLGTNENGEKISLKDRIILAKLPAEVEKVALEQLNRYEAMGHQNAESHIIKNYLELILALPWNAEDASDIDLDIAKKTLDEEHFGLEKIKEHIIQHLAVMKLSPHKKGSILLLLGPPGVGKTSLGQSIAKSLNRKYVRASLGGVRDDSEIRGHRRTYIGAMPGRIIEAIKRAKTKNPIFVLDEIDKLTQGYGGNPAASMLEVLDPEQNKTFLDHYLDLPFDLSKVFFIATANSIENIPTALLDRMDVIQLSGYTSDEKFSIAKKHLLPKALIENGITHEQFELSDELLKLVIDGYTKEAGVRDLNRKIEKILRTISIDIVKNPNTKIVLSREKIIQILGNNKNRNEEALIFSPPGVVTGLAWTPVGGDILFIESIMMPGTGKIQLTGKLGEVMSESAHIGLSLVRSRLSSLVPGFDFSKTDFHIHVPSGAIPKDGPSAGITIFTALCSLVLGKTVDSKLAMTGEITLRGAVLPVGGLKEKFIAAHRAGIKKIIVSRKNEDDIDEIPINVKRDLEIIFVDSINDLLQIVFGKMSISYFDNRLNPPQIELNEMTHS